MNPTLRLLPVSVALLAFVGTAFAASPRPNYVFIIGDDISAEDFGCYGNRGIRTPNIDRLATEAIRFDHGTLAISSCRRSKKPGFRRGQPPGAATHALQINHPGPIRE